MKDKVARERIEALEREAGDMGRRMDALDRGAVMLQKTADGLYYMGRGPSVYTRLQDLSARLSRLLDYLGVEERVGEAVPPVTRIVKKAPVRGAKGGTK